MDHYKSYASITSCITLRGAVLLSFILWSTCIPWSIIDRAKQFYMLLAQPLIQDHAVQVLN